MSNNLKQAAEEKMYCGNCFKYVTSNHRCPDCNAELAESELDWFASEKGLKYGVQNNGNSSIIIAHINGIFAGATYQHEATIEKVMKIIETWPHSIVHRDRLITAIKEIKV